MVTSPPTASTTLGFRAHRPSRCPSFPTAHRALLTGALVGVGVAGVVTVALLALAAGGSPYVALGNGDPGALVRIGAPLVRFVTDGAATLCVGFLVFAACFTEPRGNGGLAPGGYAAVRAAGRWALVWLLAALASVPLTIGDTSGEPLSDVLVPGNLRGLLSALEEPRAWLVTAGVVAVVAVGARAALRWSTVVGLGLLAVFAVLPPLVTGHASSDAGHDIASMVLLAHVPAAVVWLGVLVAFVTHVARTGGAPAVLGARYARLATGCWVVLVATGLVDAMILVPVGGFGSGYGVLTLVEVGVAVALGVVGLRWRRRALAGLAEGGSPRRVAGWVGAELMLLVGGFAVAVGQTHLPPPAFLGRAVTAQETLLGYNLGGPPTVARLLADWRMDVLFGPLAVLLAAAYVVGVRRGGGWPVGGR